MLLKEIEYNPQYNKAGFYLEHPWNINLHSMIN
jgi:hypothetical protein